MSLAEGTINERLMLVGVNPDGVILLCCNNTNLVNHNPGLPCINRARPLSDPPQVNRESRDAELVAFC
jgi:hypothetical protein